MSRPAQQVDGRRALEEAAKREAEAFRPNRKPMWLALGVNGLIALLFLVVPYLRGQRVAEHSLRTFATFASCAIGGAAESSLGLALPPAERSHFADKVLHEDASWPGRCIAPLHAIVPEQAIFLWPSLKGAGADVGAAAALVERELTALHAARKAGMTRVPERPLLAIGKLRAALTLLARAADVSDSLDEPAVRFDRQGLTAIEPSRLPLMAAESAAMDMWLRKGGIEALALDVRGLSWMELDDGKIDRTRVKRSSLLRGTVRSASGAFGVLAMPAERCAKDEHHCLRRATGVASVERDALFAGDAENPLAPEWLAAHPAGRFDRSVRIDALSIDVLALAAEDGSIALRRFTRSQAEPEAAAAPEAAPPESAPPVEGEAEKKGPRPASASKEWPLGVSGAGLSAMFLPERSALDVGVALVSDLGVGAQLIDPRTGTQFPIGIVPGAAPFITACRDAPAVTALERSLIAFGSDRELTLVRVEGAQAPVVTALARATLPVHDVLHPDDPARDRVQVRCDGASTALLVLTDKAELVATQCEDTRCEQRTIAPGVTSFAATFARGAAGARLVIAISTKNDPSIALSTWQLGKAPSALRVLSGCWDPAAGMCGVPALAADGAQVVLAARERGDLRVIESRDAGATWSARPDMEAATLTNLAAPMDQHRMRKGLEK